MFNIAELERAAEVVHKVLPETPQIRWPLLCQRVEADVWVKQENHTPIGAFKIRGALFYISELQRKYPEVEGVIAATRGNFGQSVTFAGVACRPQDRDRGSAWQRPRAECGDARLGR